MRDHPIEIELKRLLAGEGATDKLVAALGPVAARKQQTNYVLDTDDFALHRQKYVVRLRFEDGSPILTAKGPSRSAGDFTYARTEAEAEIERSIADCILSGDRDPVDLLRARESSPDLEDLWEGLERARRGRPLGVVGHFVNRRTTVPVVLPGGLALQVEIDHTRFPDGRVDDEVEIEVPREDVVPTVEAWLNERAVAAGVTLRPSTPKIARFYDSFPGGHP
jgi:hypothetical protein